MFDLVPAICRIGAARGCGIAGIIEDVQGLQYRQPQRGVRTILGQLDDSRGFVPEFIHPHPEAYVRALDSTSTASSP